MADSRSIIVDTTTQNGIKKQKSFTDVDPEATAVEMLNFANAAVQLTTDTFTGASVVDKSSLIGAQEKEQLIANKYTETVNYPSTTSTLQLDIKHADGTYLKTNEIGRLNITAKTYETDVFVALAASSGSTATDPTTPSGSLKITIAAGPTAASTSKYWGINQSITPIKPISELNGAGRIEITIHEDDTYTGFTYTLNINAKA